MTSARLSLFLSGRLAQSHCHHPHRFVLRAFSALVPVMVLPHLLANLQQDFPPECFFPITPTAPDF